MAPSHLTTSAAGNKKALKCSFRFASYSINKSVIELSNALHSRCDCIKFPGYSWEQKRRMVNESMLPLYCKEEGGALESLTAEDYKGIDLLIDHLKRRR